MIFIDTNVFLNYLYETSLTDKAENILSMEELNTSGIVIDTFRYRKDKSI